MKVIISIPLILLILFSGISVKFDTHYCRGHVAGTKVSLNGEMATCGMERSEKKSSSQQTFTTHCCEDVAASYSIENIYIPSNYNFVDQPQQDNNFIYIPVALLNFEITNNLSADLKIRPPGTTPLISQDQSVLCIFQI